jgi:hypothetical protein
MNLAKAEELCQWIAQLKAAVNIRGYPAIINIFTLSSAPSQPQLDGTEQRMLQAAWKLAMP